MKKDIQILIVDDHQVVRDGLQHMLAREEDMEVVGQGADSEETLSQLERLSPNIVLMDIKMAGMDGIELTRRVKQKQPSCNVIMLTLYDEYLTHAMEAGAKGYLLKDAKREELTQAIRQVYRGEVVISESIASKTRFEYEERRGKKAEEGSGTMVEEVQLVILPPVEANQLMRFIGRAEKMLQSQMELMIGSWKGSTAITLPLPKPTPLSSVLNKLGKMSEVEATGEEPPKGNGDSRLLKKVTAMPKPKNRLSKFIFVTLKNN